MLMWGMALALVACAPAQGQKPHKYQATPAQVIAVIVEEGPKITPLTGGNPFSVTGLTPNSVTLSTGTSLLFGNVQVTFSVLDTGGSTLVTHGYTGSKIDVRPNSMIDQDVQSIYRRIAIKYPEAP